MSLLFFVALFLGALVSFLILAWKGRLDMNEKPKHQMMDINEKKPPAGSPRHKEKV
jgi:hypothetical protein